jgi:hypothetical protein
MISIIDPLNDKINKIKETLGEKQELILFG